MTVIDVALLLVMVAEMPSNMTIAPERSLPLSTTLWPPAVVPVLGAMEVIDGRLA